MPTRRTIGVDFGGTRLLVGAVDAELDVHHRTQRAVSGLDQSSLLDAAVDAIEEARSAAGSEIAAVGFGIPSRGEGSDRTLSGAEALADVSVADVMAERIGLPAFVDTDANVAALAERRGGAAHGLREAIVVTIGSGGVRAAVILGGELQRRAGRVAAPLTGAELASLVERAHDRDPEAIDALAALGRRIGELIGVLAATYAPQVVVIGGAMMAAGDLLLGPVRGELAGSEPVAIVAARFGVDAGLVGAAVLAFDGVERRAA